MCLQETGGAADIHTRQIILVWNKNTEEKTKQNCILNGALTWETPPVGEIHHFLIWIPTFFLVFLNPFNKNGLQLLKGSYTFWTLWFLIIVTVGHTTLYFCEKCHRKCHLRTRQPAGWEWDSAEIQNLLTQSKMSSDSTSSCSRVSSGPHAVKREMEQRR